MFRLLQIEDDPMDVRLLEEALRECSIEAEIRVAPDGLAGLEILRESATDGPQWRPDLIVCDLNMPRLDGHGFLGQVKSNPETRSIPVIILSSSPDPTDVAKAYALNANCFIRKPVAFDELCVVARRIDEFWNDTAELPRLEARA